MVYNHRTGLFHLNPNRPSCTAVDPEPIYALSRQSPDARISNLVQFAAYVINAAKSVILRQLHLLLNNCSPFRLALCYMDTDSIIVTTSRPSLDECVMPEKRAVWRESVRMSIMEKSDSLHPQVGCQKLEGMFGSLNIRSIKSYRLEDEFDPGLFRLRSSQPTGSLCKPPAHRLYFCRQVLLRNPSLPLERLRLLDDDDSPASSTAGTLADKEASSGSNVFVRAKGVPMKLQRQLEIRNFLPDPRINQRILRSRGMTTDAYFNITISEQERKLMHGLNFNRYAIDAVNTLGLP